MSNNPKIKEKFLKGLLIRLYVRMNKDSEYNLPDEDYETIDPIIRSDYEAALISVDHGSDLSSLLGYGFSDLDLSELAKLHKADVFRDKIEDLLEDCNFHTACRDFSENRYTDYIIGE